MHVSPSNKRYIGITCQKEKERWANGKGYRKQSYFYRAIEKYGWDNFEHIIIARGLTEDEAKWLEVELIREWNTTNQNKGYNISIGGEGGNGCKHTEEWKEEHSKKVSGENNPMFGRQHTEETKRKISESRDEYCGENHPMFVRQHTEETKRKISEANSGENNHGARKVICITTNEIFPTAKEGAKKYNCCRSGIIKCCRGKGKVKSCGKHPITKEKLVWMYYENYLKMIDKE